MAENYSNQISQQTSAFILAVVSRCKEQYQIDVSDFQSDHVCWRCETKEEYKQVCDDLSASGAEKLVEAMIGGRPICTFKPREPLPVDGSRTVECIEVSSPKEGSYYTSGLEHVEFVIADASASCEGNQHLQEFKNAHSSVNFDERAFGKEFNADLCLSLDLYENRPITCHFHQRPLSEVVVYETSHGKVIPVPNDYFD